MNYIIGAFKPPCDISITFSDARTRKQVSVKKDNGKTTMVPVFQSLETISGEVSIAPVPGKRIEHMGVKIELLGQIELYFDRGNFYDFTSLVRELDVPGEIYERKTYPFEFSTVEMPYESYNGTNVRLRYILKVTIGRNYVGNIVEYRDFCVRNYSPVPTINNSIKMEVGIEDCLHIEFEYSKSKYHLNDVIIGKIYFLLVRIKIKNMELEIRRRESTGSGSNTYVETETLVKFELMDGAPVREDGTYAMKKVLIQSKEQLDLVKEEIRVSSLFKHPNLLLLLDHAIIAVKSQQGDWSHEVYLLFPVYLDGTLFDNTNVMLSRKEFHSTGDVLQIFRQLCEGLKHMHNFDPPYAHNDVKPGNVLITSRRGQAPTATLMDFGSARPARKEIHSRSEALQLQEWAAEHCSAPYHAPELWDCPSHADIDERTDIWSLGCTLYAIMYNVSPFEYALGESGGSLQLAIVNGQLKWPAGPNPPYPDELRKFVTWMLQPQPAMRPHIGDIVLHVDKLITKYL